MRSVLWRVVSGLLCVAMILCMIPALAEPVSAETGYDRGYAGKMAGDGKIYAHGLDVSAWQESGLNFQNFANAGYDYVILRCGTSVGKDKCFEEYYASAKAAGLDVGCYYYSYATSPAEAKAEALEMIQWMGNKVFEYPIYYDYEDVTQSEIDGATAAKICYAFMDTLKANGYLVGMYSMASWLEQGWVTSSGIRATYEGWVANVPSEEPNSGITSNLYMINHDKYKSRYGMYQYSFDTWVNGAGPFDANVCYKDYPAIVKKYGFNGYQKSESWIEKACFDVMVYRDRNPDIAHLSDTELKQHWLNHGIKEGRASSTVLDLKFYLNNNPDLKEAFGTDYEKVYNHFITKGYKEYRKSSALFDGSYYCERYPEVKSSYKEEYLRHYVENGMKEGRRASLTFDPKYYWYIRPDVYEAWPNDYVMCARHYAGHGINAQIEAYDNKYPVISNVTVSNISAEGYTVSCTVTDDWGISKVAFPTWTLLNNQDDLPENFLNTQLGTKNGSTYTFQVKASDHNNEGGQYVTHIYAYDKGGNRTQYRLETVEVKDQKITVKSSAAYVRDENLIRNVTPETTVQTLLSQFENKDLKVLDKDGNALGAAALAGTGMTVNLYSGESLIDSVTIVVMGDLDGNGVVDTTDYMRLRLTCLAKYVLDDAAKNAADMDGNGAVNATDYTKIKDYFLRNGDI